MSGPEPKADLKERIRAAAGEAGYGDCGFTDATPFESYRTELDRRSERFPESADLYRPLRRLVDPRETAPWARSIVACVLPYRVREFPAELEGRIGTHYLCDRRYPGHPDHDVPKRFKAALESLGLRVKKGGVPERLAAARAGVVRFGRNNFAYHNRYGSWISLEAYRVDALLEPERPSIALACPEGCTRCIDACPTGALSGPLSMRYDLCIAHLTYGAPLPVPPELEVKMGRWIYGCDVCQEVCPLNRGSRVRCDRATWLEPHRSRLSAESLSTMDLDAYRTHVHPLFGYISDDEEGLERWKRNARRSLEASADDG